MINGNVLNGLDTFLPVGMFMIYPLWLFDVAQAVDTTPTAIEAQGWLIAVVASAMGLVRIAMWLRNYKEEKTTRVETFHNSTEIIERAITKLTENNERLLEKQEKLVDAQMKALENHAKLSEALTLLRMQLQVVEQNITSSQDKRAIAAVAEVKDIIREIRAQR